jgi:GNAT superfamily N-acetyltransferase
LTGAADLIPVSELPVRRLTGADLPAIVELAADRGWPAEESKWRLMLAVSEPYGVDDPVGGLAGIVVLTRYGDELAAVGMMLVASRHGRRGLGRRLMQHVLALAGRAVVYLTATDEGRPLYEQLGFRVAGSSVTYRGVLAADRQDATPAGVLPRPVAAADLDALAAVDAEVFGADRKRVLAELVTFADSFLTLPDPADGYAAAWTKDGTLVIGPVVAGDLAGAARLIAGLTARWRGPVRLDILGRHQELADWALARGLTRGDATALMTCGGDLPGARARLYGPVTVAIG